MKGRRIISIGAKLILALALISIAALFIFRAVLQKEITKQLTKLSPALKIKFASVDVDVFSSSVSFDSLSVKFTPYPDREQNSHRVTFPAASLKQVSFLKFFFQRRLIAERLVLKDGKLQLDQFLMDKTDSTQSQVLKAIGWPFQKFFIRRVEMENVSGFLTVGHGVQSLAHGDVYVNEISIDSSNGKPSFSGIDLRLADLRYSWPHHTVSADKLTISTAKRTIEVSSLQLSNKDGAKPTLISSIKITGVDIAGLMERGTLDAKRIMMEKSKIMINKNSSLPTGEIPFDLKKIHADVFELENASVSYTDNLKRCSLFASLTVQGFAVSEPFKKRDIDFSSFKGNLSSVRYSTGTYHTIAVSNIQLENNKIEIDDLKIIPQLGKYQLGRKLRHQVDWVQATIPKIEITRPDIKQLLHQKLLAEKITVNKSNVYVFRDRRLSRPQKIIPLPVAYVKTLPLDLRIKKFELTNSAVTYEEYPRQGYGQTGILRIERITATVSPLINHPVASDPAYIRVNVKGSIMGSGSASAAIIMPLKLDNPYRLNGRIERLELTKLNSSSENLGKIRIKSGFLDFLSFDFTMTDQRSTGKIIGAYHNLIIQQLKKHTEEKNVADFASFMLRHLIIPLNKDKSLPEKKRTGLVNYQRDPTRFVSHYFLQSLLMGVKKSFTLGFLLPK